MVVGGFRDVTKQENPDLYTNIAGFLQGEIGHESCTVIEVQQQVVNGMKYRCSVTCDNKQYYYVLYQSFEDMSNGLFEIMEAIEK